MQETRSQFMDAEERQYKSEFDKLGLKIRRYGKYDTTLLSENITCMAANVENAYMNAGVKDYTAKDCVDHAISLIIHCYPKLAGDFHLDTITAGETMLWEDHKERVRAWDRSHRSKS